MKVLFNGDDFGLTEGITDGIIKAHKDGVVNSATIMMNGNAIDYAIVQAKQTPTLKTGIHLVLSWGKPISRHVDVLTNEEGNFKFSSVMQTIPDVQAVKREWKAQIEAYLQTGLRLHHMDSHHHVHGWEPLKEVVIDLAAEYQVPVRYVPSLQKHPDILLTEKLWTGFYQDGVKKTIFNELKDLNVSSVEVMTHPAYVDRALGRVSSYVETRKKELDILCSIEVPPWVELL